MAYPSLCEKELFKLILFSSNAIFCKLTLLYILVILQMYNLEADLTFCGQI